MSRRARLIVCAASGAIVFAFLIAASIDLPAFGTGHDAYPNRMLRATIEGRRASNAVTAVTYDMRGFDSLGEEMMLFGSVSGVILLLAIEDKKKMQTRFPVTPLVRVAAVPLVFLIVIVAIELASNGHLGMGGGFQAGVLAFGGFTLLYFAGGLKTAEEFADLAKLELAAGVGGGIFIVIGLIGLAVSGSFLTNWLPQGTFGQLFSGGTIPLISVGVGIEVAAGFAILLERFASHVDQE